MGFSKLLFQEACTTEKHRLDLDWVVDVFAQNPQRQQLSQSLKSIIVDLQPAIAHNPLIQSLFPVKVGRGECRKHVFDLHFESLHDNSLEPR